MSYQYGVIPMDIRSDPVPMEVDEDVGVPMEIDSDMIYPQKMDLEPIRQKIKQTKNLWDIFHSTSMCNIVNRFGLVPTLQQHINQRISDNGTLNYYSVSGVKLIRKKTGIYIEFTINYNDGVANYQSSLHFSVHNKAGGPDQTHLKLDKSATTIPAIFTLVEKISAEDGSHEGFEIDIDIQKNSLDYIYANRYTITHMNVCNQTNSCYDLIIQYSVIFNIILTSITELFQFVINNGLYYNYQIAAPQGINRQMSAPLGNEIYNQKYLKYKQKYLQLKNNLNN